MAFRTVGAVGIKVRPDTTKFHEELQAKLRAEKDVHVEIPVEPSKDISKTRLEQWANAATAKAVAEGIRVRVPATLGNDTIVSDVKRRVDLINEKLQARKDIRVRIPAVLDDRGLAGSVTEVIQEARRQVREKGPVDLPLTLDFNDEKAKKQLDKFIDEESGKNVELKIDVDHKGLASAQLAALSRDRDVNLRVRIEKRAYATAVAALQGLTGLNVIKNAGRFLEDLTKNIDEYALAVGKLGIAWGNIVNLTGAGVGGLATIAGGLAQMGGAALALPSAAVALASFVVVGVAAFKNFHKAVSGNATALAALPPVAQDAARSLNGVWTAMQVPIQSAFWTQVGPAIQEAVHGVIAQFNSGLTDVGGALGSFTRSIFDGLATFAKKDVYRSMFADLSTGLGNMSKGVPSLVRGLVTIGDETSKFLPAIGDWVARNLESFERWIGLAAQTGRLADWIHNASVQTGLLKDSLKAAYGILHGVADAARGGGFGGLQNLRDDLERIRGVVEGVGFQNTMATLFDGARDGAHRLLLSLSPLGQAIEDLAPQLSTVMSSVGGTLGGLITSVANAMHSTAFKNGFTGLFTGLQQGVQGFSGYMQSIVDGIGTLASISGRVFQDVLPVVGQFFGTMGDTLGRLQGPLQNVTDALSGSLSRGVTLIGQAASIAAGPVGTILDMFSRMPQGVQDALLAMVGVHKLLNGISFRDMAAGIKFSFTDAFKDLPAYMHTAGREAATAVRVGFANQMQALSPAMQQAMNKDLFGTFFRNIAQDASAGFASIGAKAKVLGSAMGKGLIGAGRDLMNFLGGPWGLAMVAASVLLSSFATDAQRSAKMLSDMKQNADDLANIKLQNPLNPTNNIDAQNKAYDLAQNVIDKAAAVGQDLSGHRQSLMDVVLGTATPAEISEIQELQKTFDKMDLNGIGRGIEFANPFDANTAAMSADVTAALNEILAAGPQAANVLRDKLGQASNVVATNMAAASETVDKFGVITLKNVPLITHAISSFGPNGVVDVAATNVTSMAEIMSEAIGGTADDIGKNSFLIAKNLSASGDGILDIARFMSDNKFTNPQITKALEALGYTSDQAAAAIQGSFLPALASVPAAFQGYHNGVRGIFDSVPLLTKASDGIKEVAAQIGKTENIDPALLENIFRTYGTGAQDVVQGLSAAGVKADVISKVLSDMGIDTVAAGSAMLFLKAQVDKALGPGSISVQAAQDFATALANIATNAQDAATRAQGLRDALDQLNGGKLDTQRISAQFFQAVDDLQAAFKGTGDNAIDWKKIFNKDGSLNLALAQNRTLFGDFDTLATNALAKASDAYDKTFKATGDYAQAANAAKTATGNLATTIETSLVKELGTKAKPEIDAMLTSFGLWPDQLVTDATVNARGATDPLATVLGLIEQVKPGATVPIGAQTTDAISKLSGLGIKITTLADGTYVATLDADPAKAKAEIDGLQTLLNSKTYTATVEVKADLSSFYYNIRQAGGIRVGPSAPLADGGIIEKVLAFAKGGMLKAFASGGIENHTAHIARTMRIFAEPETGGEAYIPLSPAKRGRSVAILADVAHRFGYTVERLDTKLRRSFANGGVDETYVSGGSTFNINVNNPQAEPTSKTILLGARYLASYGA